MPKGIKSAFGKASDTPAVANVVQSLQVRTSFSGCLDKEASIPTPNGLAELASLLSGDLNFEDVFDHGSRRASGIPDHLDEEEPPTPTSPTKPSEAAIISVPPSKSPAPITITVSATGQPPRAFLEVPSQEEWQAAREVQVAQCALLADGPVLSSSATDKSAAKLGPQDFEILKVVGQGAFGKVFQVRQRGTGKVYAMKVMRKERILQKEHGDYVKAERDLLTAVLHPYIVTLRYSFQTPSKLYLVLDFLNGGHLFFNLYRQGVFGDDVAKLYTAEMVSALSYLHSRGIVHRDLKPENVLLDAEGHIRLTDFGLAKGAMDANSRTNSFIGTMEYMAPEIIEGKGHGKEVDWWSTGILLYEMLAGVPPFRAKSRQQLQTQIISAKPKFPKFLSSDALSLLKGLLTRDSAKRLGAGPNGSAAVKAHPFFKGISWAKLEARELESKFKPSVRSVCSVENFDKIWTDQKPVDSPCGTPTDPNLLKAFEGFTYIAPSFMSNALAGMGV